MKTIFLKTDEYIYLIRKGRNLSQLELAKILNTTQATISRAEHRNCQKWLSRLLEVDLDRAVNRLRRKEKIKKVVIYGGAFILYVALVSLLFSITLL